MISVSVSARIQSELEKLKHTAGSASMTRNTQFNTLSHAAHYVTTIGDNDARLQVLRRVSAAMGCRDGQWLPGPKQIAALQRHPHGLETVPPHKILDAVTMASLDDFIDHTNRAASRANGEVDTLRQKVRALEERPVDRSQILDLQAARDRHRDIDLARKQEVRALRDQNDTLRAALEGRDDLPPAIPEAVGDDLTDAPVVVEQPKAWDSAPKHKQRVPGKPGVYFKVSTKGELLGFGATAPRQGEPGKTQDAGRTFASVPAAEEWRANTLNDQTAPEPQAPTPVGVPQGGSVASFADVMGAIR